MPWSFWAMLVLGLVMIDLVISMGSDGSITVTGTTIKWLLCPLWIPILLVVHYQDRKVKERRAAMKARAEERQRLIERADREHSNLIVGYIDANERLIKAGIYGKYQPIDLNSTKAIDRLMREKVDA